MTTTTASVPPPFPAAQEAVPDQELSQRRDALAERLFHALIGGVELLSIELGRRLGLYAAVHRLGVATSADLADEAGVAERYAREWLEQQAAAGLLEAAGRGRFELPAAHVPVLLVEDDPAYVMAAAPLLTGVALSLPAVAGAYRSGEGVPYEQFGAEVREGLAAFNRPSFANDLADWLAALPDITSRLTAGGRVLDLGCGVGWSSIALATCFPDARVVGVDMDRRSIDEARKHAEEAGVEDRVTFEAAAADTCSDSGPYDLVCIFEALHDMGHPVAALRHARELLAPGGAVLIADELVADEFTAPAGEVERMQYAFSVLHCLPATMAESPSTASGTVLRTPTVRDWARRAGFATLEVLPVEHMFWRFYRASA
jgi:2-polyprenyl-3-methyl-5-hydroxy-6-metoxy-1,4-benzoquinol methylase